MKGFFKKFKKKSGGKKAKKDKQIKDNAPELKLDVMPGGKLQKSDLLQPITSLKSAKQNQRVALFIHKLRLCSIIFEWSSRDSDPEGKEIKRQQLMELVEFLQKAKGLLGQEQILLEIVNMLKANLFRALPPAIPEEEMEEDEPVFDPSWPHLQIVYEFFLRFIVSGEVDLKLLGTLINAPFVTQLLILFDSQDHRERDYLKTILHRIYAKFMPLRGFIRSTINNTFYTVIYETGHHNGIAELLEILGSIINGFALPIKAEHKRFLANVLVPLHRIVDVTDFHAQLCYCVTQFVDKDPSLSSGVISGLLKTWPVVSSTKELLMVNELEELLELTPEEGFVSLIPRLFRRISLCLSSNHFQVAERTLLIWHNEYISGLIATHRAEILPIIYPALKGQPHWNATVNNLCMNVLKIFSDIDPDLVTMCAEGFEKQIHEQSVQRAENAQAWIRLEKRCARII